MAMVVTIGLMSFSLFGPGTDCVTSCKYPCISSFFLSLSCFRLPQKALSLSSYFPEAIKNPLSDCSPPSITAASLLELLALVDFLSFGNTSTFKVLFQLSATNAVDAWCPSSLTLPRVLLFRFTILITFFS